MWGLTLVNLLLQYVGYFVQKSKLANSKGTLQFDKGGALAQVAEIKIKNTCTPQPQRSNVFMIRGQEPTFAKVSNASSW